MAQRRERVQAGAKWTGNLADLVFTTRYGTPLPANYTTEAWTARVARAGLPHRKLHDARHFAASTYFASGARMEDVAKYLGHADGSTVTRLYVHLADQVNAGAAAAMDALFPARPVPVDASGAGRP